MLDLSQLPYEEQQLLLNRPSLPVPPPGSPLLQHNTPHGNQIALAAIIICHSTATIFIALRAYSRIFLAKQLSLDDYLGFIGYAFLVAFAGIAYRTHDETHFFTHLWDVKLKDLAEALYVLHVGSDLYIVSVLFLKSALLCEWMRTFAPRGTRGRFYIACQVLLWLNVIFYGGSFIAENLSCTPHRAIWDKTIGGRCANVKGLDLVASGINLVSDVLVLTLPHAIIWRLNMSNKKKIRVSLFFCFGVLTVIAGILRLIVSIHFVYSPDSTYWYSPYALWSLAEMTLLLIIFTIPELPRFRDPSVTYPSIKNWTDRIPLRLSSREDRVDNAYSNPSHAGSLDQESGWRLGSAENPS